MMILDSNTFEILLFDVVINRFLDTRGTEILEGPTYFVRGWNRPNMF
jgi:hypothetical protein